MGHLTTKDAYQNLEQRINWFTQGAPASDTLFKILQVLFTEKEAKWVSMLPVRPFTLKKAAKIWGTTELEAEKLLDHLCEKGLIVDNQAFASHRAMAAVFGTILKLPPAKQALASKQFKSVYLDRLLSRKK